MFPRIDRPCPYVDRLGDVMDGDWCRMCKRTVTDLSAMDEAERRAFLRGCAGEEVCVRYTVRPALAAAALAASVAALPAAAQQAPAPMPEQQPAAEETDLVLMGGIMPWRVSAADRPVTVITAEDIGKLPREMRAERWRKARTRRGE